MVTKEFSFWARIIKTTKENLLKTYTALYGRMSKGLIIIRQFAIGVKSGNHVHKSQEVGLCINSCMLNQRISPKQ